MNQDNNPILRKTAMLFSFLMVAVILGMGILILVTGYPHDIPASNRIGLAIILLVYGSFRAYRVYNQYK